MRSFIIHMPSSTARWPNAQQLCRALPDAEVFDAVDGRTDDTRGQVECHKGDLHRPTYPFALRPAEVGVFQSHRAIWQKMVDENIDVAIITEDDLAIDPDRFAAALALAQPFFGPDIYLRLPVKQREKPAKVLAEAGGQSLILPKTIGLQCICQIVGRGAAERLLARSHHIDRPVDTFIQMHWITGQPVHALLGAGNQEIAGQIGGSTIQVKPGSGKIRREVRRALYRMAVARRPQRP